MKFEQSHLVPLGLITGGILVLWHFYSQSGSSAVADGGIASLAVHPDLSSAVQAQQDSSPKYPASEIAAPSISIGGSPLYLNYNTPNPSNHAVITDGSNGCDCGCGGGTYSASLKIPQGAMDSAFGNLQSLFPTNAPDTKGDIPAVHNGVKPATYTFSEA